jgi:membrane associated rhomboid family serine protease
LLQRTPVRDYVSRVWVLARSKTTTGPRLCPVCAGPMVEVPSLPDYASPTLDVCRRCYIFWFDPKEFERVPVIPQVARPAPSIALDAAGDARKPSSSMPLPAAAVEALAIQRAATETERLKSSGWGTAGPDAWWQWIPGLLGLPVEVGAPVARVAWATWGLVAVITAVSIAAFFNLERAVQLFGLVPAHADRLYGLTLLSSFLLHGGVLHLVGNLYYLVLFGDNVEDYLGPRRFLVLVALAAVVGDIAHVAFDHRSEVPLIGASGGISGLVAFYGLQYPRAKMAFVVFFRWFRVPAYLFLAFWLSLQALTAWQQVSGLTSVSALAHLGGAAVGVWFWFTWRGGSHRHV